MEWTLESLKSLKSLKKVGRTYSNLDLRHHLEVSVLSAHWHPQTKEAYVALDDTICKKCKSFND